MMINLLGFNAISVLSNSPQIQEDAQHSLDAEGVEELVVAGR